MLYFMYNEDCNRVVRTTKSGRKRVLSLHRQIISNFPQNWIEQTLSFQMSHKINTLTR